MKLSTRQRSDVSAPLPGLTGQARVERRTRVLIGRLRPGDIAILDHLDMDQSTAQDLVDAGVAAVVNASPFISGRYPNLGPEVLSAAGVVLVDGIGAAGLAAVRDGAEVRIHGGTVYVGDSPLATGRAVDRDVVHEEMSSARLGLASQLESFTHTSAEFLRREQDVLLHGQRIPRASTKIAGRPVVVVAHGPEFAEQLRIAKAFAREQGAVLVGVDRGADALLDQGLKPDVVVVSARPGDLDEADRPSRKALKAAKDVVAVVPRGSGKGAVEPLERLGLQPVRFETGATAEDAALILADHAEASVIVGVGLRATLDAFLDRQRDGHASTYLTRLKVGPRLVDATTLQQLYAGRVRPWHLFLVLVAGLLALAVAVGVTPVGQEWSEQLGHGVSDLVDYLQGLLK